MTTVSTKHFRRASDGLRSDTVRSVEEPYRYDRDVIVENAVVLGATEPPEGRYTTTSRLAYLPTTLQPPKAGEGKVLPITRPEVESTRRECERFMRDKNFVFGFEGVELPMISEARGAQQSAVDLRRRPSLTQGTVTSAAQGRAELQGHMARMRRSSVFAGPVREVHVGGVAVNSTQRESYGEVDQRQSAALRDDAARLRRVQRETHWAPDKGVPSRHWRSEKAAEFDGRSTPPAAPSQARTQPPAALSSDGATSAERLRSLKEIDFVPHPARPPVASSINCHDHTTVLGSDTAKADSTYRVSFTQTRYVPPAGTPRRPKMFTA